MDVLLYILRNSKSDYYKIKTVIRFDKFDVTTQINVGADQRFDFNQIENFHMKNHGV